MTAITHHTEEYNTRAYRGQPDKIRGLSHSQKQQRIIHETEKVIDIICANIGRIEYCKVRGDNQRNERRAKRQINKNQL